MAFRRRRGGFKRRTHWLDGVTFLYKDAFTMDAINDPLGVRIGWAHAVQLTGDQDILDVGGESAVTKRLLGVVQPLFFDDDSLQDPIKLLGARCIQSIQILTIPRSTQVAAQGVATIASWLVSQDDGLGSEDILWTRLSMQPRANPVGFNPTYADISTWTQNKSITGVIGNTATWRESYGAWNTHLEWGLDVSVSRRLESEKSLWLITQIVDFNGDAPTGAALPPTVRYNGYLRMLAVKGR